MEPMSTAEIWYGIKISIRTRFVISENSSHAHFNRGLFFQLKMTPLHWAVEREHVEVMHILLEHGADMNASSKFNKTPLSLALEHDRLDLVDILRQEREITGIQAQQQSQASSAELDISAHNLIQLETESNSRSSITSDAEQQKFTITQQQTQQPQLRKYKSSQCLNRNTF